MKIFLSLSVTVVAFAVWLTPSEGEVSSTASGSKIAGASLVNPHQPIDSSDMAAIRRVNADWVAVIPFAFSKKGDPGVFFNHERQWWGERVAGSAALISLAKSQGMKVMLKPHVWMRESWIGDYELESEEAWKNWEVNYTNYIMTFARLADSMDVEILCIGTELKKTEVTRAAFWGELARAVRKVYKGKLTYAANWDHYDRIPFWSELDYIGVNAYFPLVQAEKEVNQATVDTGWKPVVSRLRKVSEQFKKPILLTEYGYASCDQAVVTPWEEDKGSPNLELQAMAYECLYQALWKEKWVAGGFFWKWHFANDPERWVNSRFTPQNKPAEAVIARWYAIDP